MMKSKAEILVLERIENDLRHHVVTVMHSEGLYRHWRCAKTGTGLMRFDIITWPGSLCYTGDMGEYLFQRTPDMVAFMRGSCMSYEYAAEKCLAHDGWMKEWSEESFREVLAERLKEAEDDEGMVTVHRHGKRVKESVQEHIDDIVSEYENYSSENDAMKAMYESGLWDGADMPDCKELSFHFLWCLHAIKWFIGKIDAGEVVRS